MANDTHTTNAPRLGHITAPETLKLNDMVERQKKKEGSGNQKNDSNRSSFKKFQSCSKREDGSGS